MLADAVNLSRLHRVLVVKLRHYGDVLLTSPVFTVLKNRAPHLELDALVYRGTEDMLTGHPAINQVFTVDRGWKKQGPLGQLREEWKLLGALRARRYDLLVHLTESSRGAWLAHLLGPEYSVVRDYSPRRGKTWHAAFSHRYRVPGKPRHAVEMHLDALRRIGVQPKPEEKRLVLHAGAEAESTVRELLRTHQLQPGGYIHFHPTSRWLFKCWDADKCAEAINILHDAGERVVLTAAPDEAERQYIGRILPKLRRPAVDLSGRLTLKQLAALTAQAKCFVGVDSVPMHIAAAMQTPVVALFGPSGDLEWGPWMVKSRVLTTNHSCRPCGLDGCGQGKISECLTEIAVNDVLKAVAEFIR